MVVRALEGYFLIALVEKEEGEEEGEEVEEEEDHRPEPFSHFFSPTEQGAEAGSQNEG